MMPKKIKNQESPMRNEAQENYRQTPVFLRLQNRNTTSFSNYMSTSISK